MEEQTLLRICLIASIIGIGALLWISSSSEIKLSEISRLDSMVGRSVRINGQVIAIQTFDNRMVVTLNQEEKLSIVVFKAKNLSIEEGDNIQVTGMAQEYNGKLELIAEKIKILS